MNALPTGPVSLSLTVHRSRQEAPSSVSASAVGSAVRVQVTLSAVRGVLDLLAHPVGLGLHVEAGENQLEGVAVAAEGVDADLELRGRGVAADAADRDAVGPGLAELHAVEVGGDVGVEVARTLDLVDQLGGDGVDGDHAAGAVVLGDHARPVGGDLGDREAEGGHVASQLEEAGEVAPGRVGAALDHVARDHGAGQLVVGRRRPAEVRHRRADHEGGVGDAAGDHDVGTGVEGGGDAEAAEVGVGGEGVVEAEIVRAWTQVVALDVGDRGVEAEPLRNLTQRVGQARRVEAAGVADDAHARLEGEAQAVLDLAHEGAGVAQPGVLELVTTEDQHGQLGEVVAGEDVEPPRAVRALDAPLQHLAHRGEPVAVEAGAVADQEGCRGSLRSHLNHRRPRSCLDRPRPRDPSRAARRSTGRCRATGRHRRPRRRARCRPGARAG